MPRPPPFLLSLMEPLESKLRWLCCGAGFASLAFCSLFSARGAFRRCASAPERPMWSVLVGLAVLGPVRLGALQPVDPALDRFSLPALQLPNRSRDDNNRLRERAHYSCRCFPAYVKARATWDHQRLDYSSQGGDARPSVWELAPSAQATWTCGAGQRNADASECLAAVVAATSGAANGIKLVDTATVPPGCSYSHVSGVAVFNSGTGQVGSEKGNYQLVCTPFDDVTDAEAFDAMFHSAAPPFAEGIGGSGVCAHMLDPDDDHTADAPWLGCNEADVTSECPEITVLHTRSCTEINAL